MRSKVVLALGSDALGRGDESLGRALMVNFVRTWAFRDIPPDDIVCFNAGVKLAAKDSPALPFLQALADKGARIVSCGTCVNHFQLANEIAIGQVGDMHGIVEILATADNLVSV